jgi:hypothetical protein
MKHKSATQSKRLIRA